MSIEDLGVIARAHLDLGPGLTALTGETGAGKTMVLSSLRLLLGHKADPAIVRHGAERAVVEGEWSVPDDAPARDLAADAGAELDDDVLLVARTVSAQGRSRAHAGGRTVPAALLTDIGDGLVTVHGQADQLRLREPARQRAALDTFGGADHLALVTAAAEAHAAVVAARAALEERTADEGRRLAEIAALTRVAELVAAADPSPGEDEELRAASLRLEHAEALRTAATEARGAVAGDEDSATPGASALVAQAAHALAAASGHDPALAALAERVAAVGPLLDDAAVELAGYLDGLDADPSALDTVHARRAELGRLIRDLGVGGVDEALEQAERAALRLAQIDGPAAEPEALAAAVTEAEAARERAATALTASRRAAAERLTAAVDAELTGLAMPGARLGIDLQELPEPGPHGAEEVVLTLATHPSAPARPLGQAASGGELSRVMLALEVCLATEAGGEARTFVFDEVDAGVGGRAAVEVGRRLAGLAERHQVVVVTHLAQVAAFATDHLVVTRGEDGVTDVVRAHGDARVVELARMLAGQDDSDAARAHAAELLSLAGVSP
ncbi:DNA repair protein RecN [Georgenia sp. Z1344]|uniref:DNA repair protein RecN n=1 Tax=Georgenia sp. Z1344 TaxID=3416706 RepID=UPI003CFBBD18